MGLFLTARITRALLATLQIIEVRFAQSKTTLDDVVRYDVYFKAMLRVWIYGVWFCSSSEFTQSFYLIRSST